MARLVSYKDKDDNRYSTFENDNRYNSNENLTTQSTFKLVEKKAKTPSSTNHIRSSRFCDWCNSFWQKLCPCVCCKKCCDWWWWCCCCFCCGKICCCAQCTIDNDLTDDVTDEIDKQFTQYKCEMQLKQINDTAFRAASSSTVAVVSPRIKGSLRTNTKRPLWNWDDSLRSNSDKFLETLEYDVDGQKSLTKSYCANKISSYFKGIYFRLIQ